ncbi:MAG: toxin-antitoxin system HicB family antitoxin [Thiobacillus sp.]|nr:toxin-antitoxin system HicB family antitoxin [Thiobacillus sp.]
MSTISVRLPDSLHKLAREVASQDHVSMNQFIASAVAEKISALATETYLNERAARGSEAKFRAALAVVPDVPPVAGDEIA